MYISHCQTSSQPVCKNKLGCEFLRAFPLFGPSNGQETSLGWKDRSSHISCMWVPWLSPHLTQQIRLPVADECNYKILFTIRICKCWWCAVFLYGGFCKLTNAIKHLYDLLTSIVGYLWCKKQFNYIKNIYNVHVSKLSQFCCHWNHLGEEGKYIYIFF